MWKVSERTSDKIVEFMKDPQEPPPPPAPEAAWAEVESDVVHLTNENFLSTLKKKKHSLIMFYAPCRLIANTVGFWYNCRAIIIAYI